MYNNSINVYLDILNENELILQEGLLSSLPSKIHKLMSNYKLNLHFFESRLAKYKINSQRIKKDGELVANKVQRMMSKNEDVEKISNFIKDATINVVTKNLKQIKHDFEIAIKTGGMKAVLLSIAILICVIFINSLFLVVTTVFYGQTVGVVLTTVVCAPIVEEFAKRISVVSDFPYIYTTIFATTELMKNTRDLVLFGLNPSKSLIARIIGLMFHYVTTYIQKYYHEKSIISQDDKTSRYNKDESFKGYVIGVAMHSTWNMFAVIFNEELTNLLR